MISRCSATQWQCESGRLSTVLCTWKVTLDLVEGNPSCFLQEALPYFEYSKQKFIVSRPILQFDPPWIHLIVHLPCHLQSASFASVLQDAASESSFSSLSPEVLHSLLSIVSTFTSCFSSHLSLCLFELFPSCSTVLFDSPSSKSQYD